MFGEDFNMNNLFRKVNYLVHFFVVICLVFNNISPTLVYANSVENSTKNDVETSLASVQSYSSVTKVGNNSSIQRSYTSVSCSENTDIVIASGEACNLSAGSYTFTSIQIQSGGALIGSSNSTTGQGVTISTGSLIIASGGLLSADDKGYPSGTGPGTSMGGDWYRRQASGASHGGLGAFGKNNTNVGQTYGSVTEPNTLGSGGGYYSPAVGGSGGGALNISVTGAIVLNGIISTNGINGTTTTFDSGGGGAGGSLIVTANELSGNGEFQAIGGNGGNTSGYGSAGGGGGGRIALNVPSTNNSFTGVYKAYGGTGNQIGGAGTIYFSSENKLFVNNNAQNGNKTPIPSGNYNLSKIDLKGKAVVRLLGSSSNLLVTGDTFSGDNTARLEVEGIVNAPTDFTVTGLTLAILNGLSGPQNVTVNENAKLELYASSPSHPNGVYDFNNILVKSNGTLILVPFDNLDTNYSNDIPLTLNAANITVQSNGSINSNGKGYGSSTGPGEGPDGSGSYHEGAGAGHGGLGGVGYGVIGSGTSYGDFTNPTTLGSGGGISSTYLGGAGGGAVKINATTSMVLNGILSANADNGIGATMTASGGGSGGSILLTASQLTGNGEIQAIGGNGGGSAGYGSAGGGGGGRIALNVPTSNNSFTGAFKAYGGTGNQIGGAGTVFLTSENKLIINNNSQSGNKTPISSGSYNISKIDVKGKADVRLLGSSSTLQVTDNTFTGDNTGRFEVEGTVNAPSDFTVSGLTLGILNELSGSNNITIAENAKMELYASSPSHTNGVFTFNNVLVKSNGALVLVPFDNLDTIFTNDLPFTLNAANIEIQINGSINTNGKGYASSNGPGEGIDGSGSYYEGSGAGYGGLGGTGYGVTGNGAVYGDLYIPISLGSGGGNSASVLGGNGGGAIKINATETVVVNGKISANAENGISTTMTASGGGSGGSILVFSPSITGSGQIQSSGGNGGSSAGYGSGGGGGGGRIALYTNSLSKNISITVAGGTGNQAGYVGSIYLDGIDPNLSTLSISPASVVVDETLGTTVTLSAKNAEGIAVPNKPMELCLYSGNKLNINGQTVDLNNCTLIGYTNTNGVVSATISSTKTGIFRIGAKSGQLPLLQTADATFTSGPFSPVLSNIIADNYVQPPDGSTAATVKVTAVDQYGNPITGKNVVFSSNGNAIVTQQATVLDANGTATAKVTDLTMEAVKVTAEIDGVPLNKNVSIQFGYVDLALTMSNPDRSIIGSDLIYSMTVRNLGNANANNSLLTLTIPDGLSYLSDTSGVSHTQDGNSIAWNLGTLTAGTTKSFTINLQIASGQNSGTILTSQGSVSSDIVEEKTSNNSTQVSTTIVDPYTFTSQINPSNGTLYLGADSVFTINIINTGIKPDTYTISTSGIEQNWLTLSDQSVSLLPGETKVITASIHITGCQITGNYPFTVSVTSQESGKVLNLNTAININSDPKIIIDSPSANAVSGSTSVLFSWRTIPETTGVLTVYPVSHPENAQTFSTIAGSSHQVQVNNLLRNQAYTWTVSATSTCGTATTAAQTFSIGNGIVFLNHNPKITIDRDYNQQASVAVKNTDTIAHTLTTSVTNSYSDLIVNFVDSGSSDQTITLQPGQTRNIILAVHAQDTTEHNYKITANLIADSDTTPIMDNADIDISVLWDNDYTIVEDETKFDPITLGKTYVITNQGSVITDLTLTAVDPVTGATANVFMQPNVEHALLETGNSIEVVVYPIFSEEDVETVASLITHFAKPATKEITTGFTLQAKSGGATKTLSATTGCPAGSQVYPVTMKNCNMNIQKNDWYCTNRPVINTQLSIPPFAKGDNLNSASLKLNFTPQSNVLDHSGQYYFNNQLIGSFSSTIPTGQYSLPIPTGLINTAVAGLATQNIRLESQHSNSGHYISVSNVTLSLNIKQATTYACSTSAAAAQVAVQNTYKCTSTRAFNPGTDLYGRSAYSAGHNKTSNSSETDCEVSNACGATSTHGDPINVQTGVFSFALSDLSFSSLAGDIIFERLYSSGWANENPKGLGYGWFYNQDSKLIFPTDPGGMEGYVLYKSVLGNEYLFKIETDGSFSPGPGVTAKLEKSSTQPYFYTLTASNQSQFNFNETGKLLKRVDEKGNEIGYQYDINSGLLTQINTGGGSSYINLTYNSGNQIVSVSDHTGRQVSFEYDSAGDLVSSTDMLGQTWIYKYDSSHRLTEYLDPAGIRVIKTEYDMQGRAYKQYDANDVVLINIVYNADGSATVYDALGKAQTDQFDERNTLSQTNDPLGGTTKKTYDSNFRPTLITDATGENTTLTWSTDGANLNTLTDALGNTTQLDYDDLNNVTSMVDPAGHETTFTYQGTLLTTTTNALDGTTTYTYTPEGFLESITDPLGKQTTYTYDTLGRVETMTDANGKVWSYAYDTVGRLTSTTDPLGHVSKTEYNALGWVTKTISNYDATKTQNENNVFNITTIYEYDERGNQISITDTMGNIIHNEYDVNDRLISTFDAAGQLTSFTYDASGNLIKRTDALGRSTRYVYNAKNQLVSTTDALGNVTKTVYNVDGTIAKSIDALGRTTSYFYDELKRLIKTVDPAGNISSSTYDANGNLKTSTAPGGAVTTYEYDELNRLVRQTDPEGGVTQSVYDLAGHLYQSIDANGNVTTFAYDDSGKMLSQTDALGNITRFTYDANGNRISVEDPLGHVTSYAYDSLGRQNATTNALGYTSTSVYNALGQVSSSIDPLNHTTGSTYDALGRVIIQTNAQGGETHYTYDAVGNLLTTTDENGHSTSMAYDALNRVIKQTDANGLVTTFNYDAVGNLVKQTNAIGGVTQFTYDQLNRQVSTIDALGNTTRMNYDASGNLIQKTDAGNITTKYEYNKNGNLTAVVENFVAYGSVDNQTNVRTEYTYDHNGNLLTIRDANGHTVNTYTYDALNRVLNDTDALGAVTSYTYDVAGNMTQMLDANGVTITYSYNANNQLTKVDYPGTDQDVVFTYDAAGQRTGLADGVGSTTWTYNALGQPTAITDPFQKTVSYGYDAVGNKTTLTYPDGKAVNYAYDAGNRLSTVTDWQSMVTQYTYNALNLVSNVALPNAVNTNYSYDAAGRVLSIQHVKDQKELGTYSYTYDARGNRTRVVEKLLTGLDAIPSVSVTVKDSQGTLQAGVSVYAFNGTTYTGFSAITDAEGVAKFILPEGSYRFRADKFGLQYFSSPTNDCTVLGCKAAAITVPIFTDVSISVTDSSGAPQAALPVYAFTGTTYTGFNGITNELGIVTLKLPEGSYRFRADKNKEQFFSSTTDTCTTPACTSAAITVPQFDNVIITVTNSAGQPQADLPVYAFNGVTYTGYHAVTDADGHAELLLREGSYRFRADLNGLQYFSAAENHCTVMGCQSASITVPVFGEVAISVTNSANLPQEGLPVYAFDGNTYKGFSGTTDASGLVTMILPEGNYRFRTDLNGGQFFSSTENLCAVPACTTSAISVPQFESVTVTVMDTLGIPQVGLPVYAFDGSTYTGYNSTTDANGQVVLLLREGSYRFRADLNGKQYFSADANHCTVMGCTSASISVPAPLPTETPTLTATATQTELPTETPTNTPTEEPSPAPSETPVGMNVTFGKALAAMINGFKIGSHVLADATATTVTVTVTDSTGAILGGQTVYVFDGTTYKGISAISDPNGQVVFTLADGNYRFRTDRFNRQYFSGSANTCSTPTCSTDAIIVPVYGQVTITVKNSASEVQSGLNVYAFNATTYTGFSAVSGADGVALFNLPEGSYRFRADTHGLQYFSGTSNHCSVPACTSAEITVPVFGNVTVTVANTTGAAQVNLPVYVFNGTTYTGFSARTDAAGTASLTLPEGNYRFRTDLNGTQYFSNTANHCAVPTCTSAAITTPVYGSVTVSVLDSDNNVLAGLPVYVFTGATYTGRSGTTNASGQATLNLPEGSYRFRSDLNGQQYFSAATNTCTVPACTTAQITAAVFGLVTVTVTDNAGTVQPNLPVYAFKGTTYTGFNGTTDANGQVTLNLPQGNYRFRADLHGAQYFSGAENTCTVPTCTTASVVTPVYGQVTITAQSGAGKGQPDLPVYVFNEATYTGLSGVTGADGKVTLWIPAGSYRFRADQFNLQFFSSETNHCTVPECTAAVVSTLGMQQVVTEQTIDYTYDPLNRLTGASYDDGSSYAYTYDAVGNRLTETAKDETNQYTYDAANRLASVNGLTYTYDANGNLLADGTKTYTYNYANRLTQVVIGADTYQYNYNGLGDRLQSILNGTATSYSLDLNSGLTQVLADGINTYSYGFNRIAQVSETQTGYFLSDALGSVRQVVDPQAEILLAQSYSPYGEVLSSVGDYETAYSYTGEMTDGTGLVNLRARYYDPGTGRFVSKDTWAGDYASPISLNKWSYAYSNPLLYTDPNGNNPAAAVLAVILEPLIGLAAGAAVGAAAGATYGACTYEWAIAGECGCDIFEQAITMTKWEWIGMNALSGGVIGGAAGAIAATGPVGVIIVGTSSVIISVVDLIPAINEMKTVGVTPCMVTRVILDVAGIVFGATGILQGVRAWRTSGSAISLKGTVINHVNSKNVTYPSVNIEKYGLIPFPDPPYTPNNTSLRSSFTSSYKNSFRTWWEGKGYQWPSGQVEIHHIKPLQFGGNNSFENLVPLNISDHGLFTSWWRYFID